MTARTTMRGAHGGGVGAVAAGHPESARAAAEVLARGGNAADALVAGVVASWAAEPTVSGPCGGGFALVRDGITGEVALLDAFVAAPGLGGLPHLPMDAFDVEFGTTVQRFWIGVGSCAVPGTAAGVGEVHRRFGSLPWADLVAPGIALARDGVEVSPQHETLHDLLAGLLTAMPAGGAVFAPGGRLLRRGEHVRQPHLAATLERLAEAGADDLYHGALGRRIAAFFAERGAPLTATDLSAYRVIDRAPVRTRYRGVELATNAPPASGGALIAHALAVADRLPAGDGPRSAARALLLASALHEADARRTPALAAALAAGRDGGLLDADVLDAAARRVAERLLGAPPPPPSTLHAARGTTHLSVIDGRGSMAAMTSSLGCGSGVFVGDTGLHMNNMLGEEDLRADAPGDGAAVAGSRLTSMMSPTLLSSDGLEAVLGSSGSARIRSALVRVISGLVDDGLDPQEAVDLPRIHPGPVGLDVEPGLDDAALVALEAAGERLVRWPSLDIYFGGAQVAARRGRRLSAGGDPRRGGAGLVVR